jgi:hypothetical protein
VRFGNRNDRVYYSVTYDGLYRVDISSKLVDTVLSSGRLLSRSSFDIWDDSLIAFPDMVLDLKTANSDSIRWLFQPRFHPFAASTLLGEPRDDQGELVTLELSSNEATHLQARPYWASDISSAAWSPDGKAVVLSAAALEQDWESSRPGTYALWILHLGD